MNGTVRFEFLQDSYEIGGEIYRPVDRKGFIGEMIIIIKPTPTYVLGWVQTIGEVDRCDRGIYTKEGHSVYHKEYNVLEQMK